VTACFRPRQASEQNFTSAQTFSHFFRHVKGRPHTAQGLDGRSDFLRIFVMLDPSPPARRMSSRNE
jgi:hypothetical protein